jgi:Cu(I)/Ag(I) efflux system membrane protein CusA/SilA
VVRALIRASAEHKGLVLALTAVAVAFGVHTVRDIPVDAIPDLSDTQVTVYSLWDRSPDVIEDQVTYPIVGGLLWSPGVKVVRVLFELFL